MSSHRRRPVSLVPSSAFKGFRFPPDIIVVAVRWYLSITSPFAILWVPKTHPAR